MGNGSSVHQASSVAVKYTVESESISNKSSKSNKSNKSSASQKVVLGAPLLGEFTPLFDVKRPDAPSMFIGAQLCKQNKVIRDSFVKFIREYGWVESMLGGEVTFCGSKLYNEEITGAVCFNQYCLSVRSNSIDASDGTGMSKAQIVQQLKINDAKDLESFRSRRSIITCIPHKQLNPFILAGLWSLFMDSVEFKTCTENIQEKILSLSSKLSSKSSSNKSRNSHESTVPRLPVFDMQNRHEVSPSIAEGTSTCPGSPAGGSTDSPRGIAPSISASFKNGYPSPSTTTRSSHTSRSSGSGSSGQYNQFQFPGSSNEIKAIKRIKDIYFQAMDEPKNQGPVEQALVAGSWPNDLINTLDNHPRSITISDANVHKRGFPLIYVNKAFEALSQYSNAECLGRSCGALLSCDRTEADQSQMISDALRNGMGCKVALTNKRKDGTEFLNMVAIHPVYNAVGVLMYIVGVQYDVSRQDACLKEIKLIDDLLRLIGNVLK